MNISTVEVGHYMPDNEVTPQGVSENIIVIETEEFEDYKEIIFDIYPNGGLKRGRSIVLKFKNFSSFIVSALQAFESNPYLRGRNDSVINTEYSYILDKEQINSINVKRLKDFQRYLCNKNLVWTEDSTNSAMYHYLKFMKYGGSISIDDDFFEDENYHYFIMDSLRIDEFLFDHIFQSAEYGIKYLSDFVEKEFLTQREFIVHLGQFITILDANLLFPTYF